MFTLLIPFLSCLAGIQAAEAGQVFKESVIVKFYLRDWKHTASNYGWRDYSKPQPLNPMPTAVGDMVGSLEFKHANGSDTSRVITWAKDQSDERLRQCLVSLSEDPETSSITVELSPDSSKESWGEYKGFHLDCGDKIQPAAGGYPVQTPAASSSVSPIPTESAGVTPTAAESAAKAYVTNTPFKHPLLVTFMADPEHLAEPATGGWIDNTDYGWILDSSPGILDDDDKKSTVLPENTDSHVVLGQMKFYSWSATVRKYSWQPKVEGGDSYRNCTMKITSEQSVNEVWIWPVSGEMWPMLDGELVEISDKTRGEVIRDFGAEMEETQAIVNLCEPPE